ncbi:HNH endonuclease [Helicobacter rodentium]|uniref:HNH endonuclease n=1 Tax=Helicobacter rodentium TaxID=59617 RepID=UPI0023EF9B0A|nr:HNH endonuclease [Helicobacter rodentium]
MVFVKDILALHNTCAKASDIAQNIVNGSMTLTNRMQSVTMSTLTPQVAYSTTLVADAETKVAMLEAEVVTLSAGLPETSIALAAANAQLTIAIQNLALMKQRLLLANELSAEFDAFCGENIAKLNGLVGSFNERVNSLNTRINHATNALEGYFDTPTQQGSNEFTRQKSQYFEYQKLLYSMDKADMNDIEKAYIEKLNAKKDAFIASKNASELGIKISQYNMPEFDSIFEVKIAVNDFDKERYVHDRIANNELKEALKNNADLKSQFNSRQLNQIENGITPDGYTWHHDGNPPPGRLQLVDSQIHNAVRHTGGYSLWCERG